MVRFARAVVPAPAAHSANLDAIGCHIYVLNSASILDRWWKLAKIFHAPTTAAGHQIMRVWMPTIETGTGAQVYAEALASGLQGRGHHVDYDLVPHHYQYVPWLAPVKPRPLTDVVFANSWTAAAFATGIPLVTVIHHVVHDPVLVKYKSLGQKLFHRCFVRPMERAAIERSVRVVSVSHATADSIYKHLSTSPVDIVTNGIDTTYFHPGSNEPESTSPSRPMKLLFVGKPSRRKGFDIVARLVETLGDECTFTCVGIGAESGMTIPKGIMLGRVSREELRSAYRDADFLLFPSRLEGFGYVAAEAMACGTPVICASGGAVAEIVSPPECGIALDGDVEPFATKLRELWHQPDRLDVMRKAARSRVEALYDKQGWLQGMERVLMEAAVSGTSAQL